MSARDDRISVYAVATAYELGARDGDLVAVRMHKANLPAKLKQVIELATLFDELVHENKTHTEHEAISAVRARFESAIAEAFLKVQHLIQPVEYD
ncbi:MAG: hypothetical protein ACR2HJ_09640 [Fimbriimonadales bacterium]